MLRESLKPFFKNLTQDEKKVAIRAVSHFILSNSYKEYRDRIKALSKPSYELFYKEVRNFVKSSFECRKIWRAVRYSLHTGSSFQKASSDFGADLEGMTLVWSALTESEKESIEASSKKDAYGFLTEAEMTDLVLSLEKYCGKVSYLKLRFLSDNDQSFDLSDLKAELLAHGIQVVRLYEHTQDLKMIENFAKASIQNHAINLIQHFTSESRACVKNTTVGCGTCIFCLTEKPQKCPQAVADYRVTTVSMDGVAFSSLGFARSDTEDRIADESLLEALREGASPEMQRVVNLVFGAGTDEEFEAWLEKQHNVSVDSLSENPKRLVKLLCKYLDLPQKQVSEHLRERYESFKNQVA
jgi:hypothetical protein